MVNKRTRKEREHALRLLKTNRKRCFSQNIFSENNILSLDIITDIILYDREEKWICEHYPTPKEGTSPEELTKYIAAMCALDYLNGETEAEELLFAEKEQPK